MQKAQVIVLVIIGALLVLVILSIMKLNKVEGAVNKTSNRILDAEMQRQQEQVEKPVLASTLIKSLQDEMNHVKEVSVKFTE